MRTIIAFIISIVCSINTFASDSDSLSYRVFNIGNTADIENTEAYSLALKKLISSKNTPALLIINGDLIKKSKSIYLGSDSLKIFKILSILSTIDNAQIIVVPGDRDWNNSKKNGLKKVKKIENLVEHGYFKNVKWILDNGCPGPEVIALDSTLLLMTINTQWWNHPHDKPTSVDGKCDIITKKDFIIEFENALAETENKNLIIAGHFPLMEQSAPTACDYLIPLPIVGSFLASYHQNIGGTKDIVNERFNTIRKKMLKIMSVRSGAIYLSGHNRNTQILKENENYFINNGLPESSKNTSKIKTALYTNTQPSITEIAYHVNGNIVSHNYNYISASFEIDIDIPLYKSLTNTNQSISGIPINYLNSSLIKDSTPLESTLDEDYRITNAHDYSASLLKRIFMGAHYRKSWNAHIKVPILNMDTTKGGLIAYDRGGGHQTTAVKMFGNDGYAYTFRSVNKDATRTLISGLKNTVVASFLQDNVSKQHPYGGLIVAKLLDNTNILHANSELYILPNSNKLVAFKNYKGLLGTLEDHQKNPEKVKNAFANADKILQSHQLNKKLYENYNHKIDDHNYTRARVFDILVGDHGKHQDNWKWAGFKNDTVTTYSPIPRDRDLVFIQWDGILTWIADRKWAFEAGEHFGYKINDVKSLMWVARHSDRFLTNEMDKNDWIEASNYIQAQLTDSIINAALKSLPPEIYNLSGVEIEAKLKARIKDLDEYSLQYYKLLAKQVDVTGTNKEEYFDVHRNSNQTVEVSIFSIKENSDTLKGSKLLYHRIFNPDETKEIRLYGLGGKDVFNITGATDKSIKIIVVGGNGADVISDYSSVKKRGKQTKIYERHHNSSIYLGTEAKSINTWNSDLYDFQPTAFEYNRYLPFFSLNYSGDNGFGTGTSATFTKKEKFGNVDYSSKHKLSMDISTEKNNIFKYTSRYHHIIHKWDIQFRGLIANHNDFTNFFGIGNNSVKNDSLFTAKYYKTTYNSYSANISVIRDFWKKSSLTVSSEMQHNVSQIGKNTIAFSNPEINSPITFGTDDNTIFIAGAHLEIDFRDRKNLPEKGIRVYSDFKNGHILNNSTSNYTILSGGLEHYFTAHIPSPITFGIKGGGSISDGEIPFYNLTYLGNGNNLRGFKQNRFTGKSTIFINTELRVQLVDFASIFIPMRFGVKGFYDSGRVFSGIDTSTKWHNGYGGGIYWVFLNENYTFNASIAHSEEESNLFLFSIGKSFN